jgi:translation initiation factor IF-3
MEVQGKVKAVSETQTFGTFQKREFVLVTDEKYPQTIGLELHQDKVDLIDSYKVGDNVKVSINLRGKEWINPEGATKYFNSIVGWRIEKVEDVLESGAALVDGTIPAGQDDLPF